MDIVAAGGGGGIIVGGVRDIELHPQCGGNQLLALMMLRGRSHAKIIGM